MTTPGYVVLEILHVICAVIGFGALGATGAYASAVGNAAQPFADERLLRFFRPGHNLASIAVLAVPLLGAGLLIAGHGQDVHLAYPWIGLGCWLVATFVASSVIWPSERAIQRSLAAGPAAGGVEILHSMARRCSRGAAVTSLLFVVALVVMVGQP